MTTRPLFESDLPEIRACYERLGFDYEMPDLFGKHMESVIAVVDDSGGLVAVCAAERILQLYLFPIGDKACPQMKLAAVRMLHEKMADELREKGYHETNCFIPPQIERSFGRRLERSFGWVRNWTSWAKKF